MQGALILSHSEVLRTFSVTTCSPPDLIEIPRRSPQVFSRAFCKITSGPLDIGFEIGSTFLQGGVLSTRWRLAPSYAGDYGDVGVLSGPPNTFINKIRFAIDARVVALKADQRCV